MQPGTTIQLGKPTAATLAIICVLGIVSVCSQLIEKWAGKGDERQITQQLQRVEAKLDEIDKALKEQIRYDAAQNERITKIEASQK